MHPLRNRSFASAMIGLCIAGCSVGTGGGGPNPYATLDAGSYIADTDRNCGGERVKVEGGAATVAVSGDQVTLTIPDLGTIGPMTLADGKMQAAAFSFTVDGVQNLVEPFQLNLTNNNRIAGDFVFVAVNTADNSEVCPGNGSVVIMKPRE